MPLLLVRIAMVMSSWILMRSSFFLVSALAKDGRRTSFYLFVLSMKHENYIIAGLIKIIIIN